MKNWVCLFFSVAIFTTDFSVAIGKTDSEIESPVKEIGKENQSAGLEIGNSYPHTSESGDESLIPIRLLKKPIASVIVRCQSQNQQEGVVLSGELAFSLSNWDKNQFCRVKGQDDTSVDGDHAYEILIEVTSDKDREYARIPPSSRTLVNRDNDHPGLIVNREGNVTSESGKTAAVSLRLSSRPGGEVTVPLISSNRTEGIVKPGTIVFSPGNWNIPQVATVIGQDDMIADGAGSYSIQAGPLKSTDPLYHGLKSEAIAFINEDNDQAALIVNPASFQVGENGGETTVSFSLQSKPVDQVVLSLSSSHPSKGDVSPGQLVFTGSNWNVIQAVRVFGKDDLVADGDQPFIVTISPGNSPDKTYASLPDQNLTFQTKDDDTAGFVIIRKAVETTEKGGTGKIGIKLISQPLAAVTLNFTSSNPAEGKPLLESITFNETDWFVEKTLTVIGLDDNRVDGDQTYTILIKPPKTDDPRYRVLDPEDITMINKDDEIRGLQIDKDGDLTDEAGASVTLSIRLNARPETDVFLTLNSSDPSEGIVAPDRLLFSNANWDQPQSAVVTGQPDGLVDGDQTYQVRIAGSSDDPDFQILPLEVSLTNHDLNSFEILYQLEITETSESGNGSDLKLRLNSNPGGKLPVSIVSDNPHEGRVVPDRLVFDESNWDRFQRVTVHGVDDDLKDGTQGYHLKIMAKGDSDSGFNLQPPVSIAMTNLDNDQAGITVQQLSHEMSEAEGQAEFSIKLNSEPASSVIFIFSTSDETEGEMIDYHAAFFPENWNREQVIHVKGVRDYLVDGSREFRVVSLGAISQDPNYNKMAFPGFTMVCHDSDQPGFATEGFTGRVSEDGGSASFKLKLTTVPDSPVKIRFASDDEGEGVSEPDSLFFDANNWNQDHLITVTGLDDGEKDGDTGFHIRFSPAESDDPNYNGRFPEPVPVTNHDKVKMAFGLTLTRLEFLESMKDKLSEASATGLYAAYVYSSDIDLDCGFYSLSSQGTLTVQKYNLDNPMSYRLDYTGLMTGLKYFFWKHSLVAFLKGGTEVAYWSLESQNELSGNQESNSGSSLGLYAGFGADYTIIGSVMMGLEWTYHYVSRGFGNSQTTVTIKYPF